MSFRLKRGGDQIKPVDYDDSVSSSYLHDIRGKTIWTQSEDLLLRHLIEVHGTSNWTLIGESFKRRTGKQCRERWHNHLNPDIKKGDWTLTEDRIIVAMQKAVGNRWAKITKVLPGRSDNDVKNRFHATIMTRLKKGDDHDLHFDELGKPVDIKELVDSSVMGYLLTEIMPEDTSAVLSNANTVPSSASSSFSMSSNTNVMELGAENYSSQAQIAVPMDMLDSCQHIHWGSCVQSVPLILPGSDGYRCRQQTDIIGQPSTQPRISIESIELVDFCDSQGQGGLELDAGPLEIDMHGLWDWNVVGDEMEDSDVEAGVDFIEDDYRATTDVDMNMNMYVVAAEDSQEVNSGALAAASSACSSLFRIAATPSHWCSPPANRTNSSNINNNGDGDFGHDEDHEGSDKKSWFGACSFQAAAASLRQQRWSQSPGIPSQGPQSQRAFTAGSSPVADSIAANDSARPSLNLGSSNISSGGHPVVAADGSSKEAWGGLHLGSYLGGSSLRSGKRLR